MGKRQPALDGIRALAVVAVLLFHADVQWSEGGFLGVDAFFVLSGYLITATLLAERERSDRIDLVAFWARRARRLLPALGLMILVVGGAVWVAGPTDSDLRADAVAALGYFANWHFLTEAGDYFVRTESPSMLEHTWTLSIEEQFYLLWPLVLVAVGRARRYRRAVAIAAISGAVVSAALMAALSWVGRADVSRLYYGTDTRAQSLLLGAALAVAIPRIGVRRFEAYGWRAAAAVVGSGGLLLTAVLWWRVDGGSATPYRGGITLAGLATVAIIASIAVFPQGFVARTLGVLPLRALGRISYGVYLWHWPIQLGITHDLTGLRGSGLIGFRFALTVLAATLSFYLVEAPARIRVRRPVLSLQGVGAAAVALAAVIALLIQPVQIAPLLASPMVPVDEPDTVATAAPSTPVAPSPHARRVARPAPAIAPPMPTYTVAFVGDSVSMSLADGLARWGPGHGLRILDDATLGCGVARSGAYRLAGKEYKLADLCEVWPDTWSGAIARDRPDVVAIVVGRHEVLDRMHGGGWTNVGAPSFDAYLAEELERAVSVASAQGSRVALFTAPYYRTRERPDGGSWPENDPGRVNAFNSIARTVAAKHPDAVTVVDLGQHTGPGGGYTRSVDGVQVRSDGVHFAPSGCAWLSGWLLPQLRQIASRGKVAVATPTPAPATATPRPSSTASPMPQPSTTPSPTASPTPTTVPSATPPPAFLRG